MIGNDVVDLVLAEVQSNWRRKGYLQKVFTEAEQSWIATADEPDKVVWLLWSMKESAYKIFNRETGLRSFSPLSFRCEKPKDDGGYYKAAVGVASFSWPTQSYITEDYIITECYSDKSVTTYFTQDYPDYIKKGIITKNESGQPFMEGNIPVSVSHHGRFCIVSVYAGDDKEDLFYSENLTPVNKNW